MEQFALRGFRLLAKQIDSGSAQELDRRLVEVSGEMSRLNPDRSVVAASASAAAPLAQHIAERLATMQYDQAIVLRMLQRIPDGAENISLAAEQAAMAMDSLYIAYSKDAKPVNADEVRAAISDFSASSKSFLVQRRPICFCAAKDSWNPAIIKL